MKKVITYGTYDLLHYGHISLLERAKALGDYLIVGVTSDDFDMARGKINVQQTLMERIENVKATGIADEIIIEEYEGQKIDDIRKYNVDIFTVGSDWEGHFDYLKEYCNVVYLARTEGISSSEIRNQKNLLELSLVGSTEFLNKVWREAKYVNGIHINSLCANELGFLDSEALNDISYISDDYDECVKIGDAVYIRSLPCLHTKHIWKALQAGKHVLCESPLTLDPKEYDELSQYAYSKKLVLMEAIKTAYATAFERLLLLIKAGKIGEVVSVDATCTSLNRSKSKEEWSCIYEWGPTALLPIFKILGTDYKSCNIASRDRDEEHDSFIKMDFVFNNAVGTVKIGDGAKSEGELVISGTEGYIYVPAPWWKTDYFEIRYESPANNRRYYYQLEGEGIRYELLAFERAIESGKNMSYIEKNITLAIAGIMERFNNRKDLIII